MRPHNRDQVDWLADKARAESLRDAGIQLAVDHADRVHGEWGEVAFRALREFIARTQPSYFTAEEIREWAVSVPEPPDRRAWGYVMQRARRAKLIRPAGYRPHRDPSRHKGVSTVWSVGVQP